MNKTLLAALGGAFLLTACSTTPQSVDTGPTPADITASGQARSEVHWGGQIVKVKNLPDRTLIEVLALPLEGNGRPLVEERSQGRFIVDKQGFLEPHEYSANRLIEVRGHLNGFTDGQVGDAPYRYPVVISERVKLWEPPADVAGSGPRVSPRINLGVGSGGGTWGGVGVGIGF